MATRTVSRQASALARARDRRRALDKARDEHDRRVEDAAATALVALDVRAQAELALADATRQVGLAVRELLSERIDVEFAAALLDVEERDVRRYLRASGHVQRDATATNPAAAEES